MVSNSEKFVLMKIFSHPSMEMPQREFKEYDTSTIKKAFRNLVNKGYIIKKANLMDMRQKYIVLTEEGKNEVKNIHRTIETS